MGSSIIDVGGLADGRFWRYGILGPGLQHLFRQVAGNEFHQFIGMFVSNFSTHYSPLACWVLNLFGSIFLDHHSADKQNEVAYDGYLMDVWYTVHQHGRVLRYVLSVL